MKRFGGQRIRTYLAVLSMILYIFTKISVMNRGLSFFFCSSILSLELEEKTIRLHLSVISIIFSGESVFRSFVYSTSASVEFVYKCFCTFGINLYLYYR